MNPPERASTELRREIRKRPHERSGDGRWLTVYDEEGLPAMVLIRFMTKGSAWTTD